MNRIHRIDTVLDELRDERDHLAIQISLLKDAEQFERGHLKVLQTKLDMLDRRIAAYQATHA